MSFYNLKNIFQKRLRKYIFSQPFLKYMVLTRFDLFYSIFIKVFINIKILRFRYSVIAH